MAAAAPSIQALRREMAVERVSVARIDLDRATFRIVAWDGKPIFASGTELPLVTSTQVGAAARGRTFSSADFEAEPGWRQPTDGLMLALGFRSGCALPVRGADGRVRAVVSLSATATGTDYDRRLDRLRHSPAALACLAGELAGDDVALTPREQDVLLLLDAGLRFKQIALELGIAEATAKGYAQGVFRKLGVTSRAEAVFEARRRGLL